MALLKQILKSLLLDVNTFDRSSLGKRNCRIILGWYYTRFVNNEILCNFGELTFNWNYI